MIGIRRLSNDPYQYVTDAVDCVGGQTEKKVPPMDQRTHTDMLRLFKLCRPLIQRSFRLFTSTAGAAHCR
jgi:hypothetical protein